MSSDDAFTPKEEANLAIATEKLTELPANTVIEATITAPSEVTLTEHEHKTLENHVTDVEARSTPGTHTAVYDVTNYPQPPTTETTDLIGIDGIDRITITIQKHRTEPVVAEVTDTMRSEVITHLYRTDDDFKTTYNNAQENPVTLITNLVFNNDPDPEAITYDDLPGELQARVTEAIETPTESVTEHTNVTDYKNTISTLEDTDNAVYTSNVKLSVPDPETHAATVKDTLDEHGVDVINEEHTLETKYFTTLTDTPADLITTPQDTHDASIIP